MPVSEHVSNEWAKKTAQRVYEAIDQAEVVEMSSEIFSYFLCRWEKGPQCPEPRLTVGPKEYETLHHYLVCSHSRLRLSQSSVVLTSIQVGLNLVYGHMIVKVRVPGD